MNIDNIKGIIFDMDGTLVDSEIFTEKSAQQLLEEKEISYDTFDFKQFYGITWNSIESIMKKHFIALQPLPVAEILQEKFHQMFQSDEMELIPGADSFFVQASKYAKTAIATSGNRESVEFLLDRIQIRSIITTYLAAEDYQHSKPNPECYLKTAKALNLQPEQCLVFEDSIAGLKAAKAANMVAIGITKRAVDKNAMQEIADSLIVDYTELPTVFLQEITAKK